ncbi:MAG: hypothetical protein KIT14_24100 [bacterium]|nr:hypothetical protein [bacterium]
MTRAARRAVVLVLVGCALAGTACGPGPVVRRGVVNPSALRQVEDRLVRARGLPLRQPVETRALDDAALSAALAQELDASFPGNDLATLEAVYVRLGLLPAGTALRPALQTFYEGQVAAYYDQRRKQLTLASGQLEEARAGLGLLTTLTGRDVVGETFVAHELMHAIQDQHWPLPLDPEPLVDAHSDRLLARRALLEGDAVLASLAALAGTLPDDDARAAILTALDRLPDELATTYPDVPAVLREQLAFQYAAGAHFVDRGLTLGGWAAVDRAHDDPPTSTEQILHPERYFAERDRPTAITLGGTADLERAGWQKRLEDTLGELDVAILATHALPPGEAAEVAAGWDGDRLRALQRGDDWLLVWMTTWDSPADAAAFAAAAPRLVPGAVVDHRGERVLVLVGDGGDRDLRARVWATTRFAPE